MLTEKLVKYYKQVANIFCWAFLIIATLTGAGTGYDEWDFPGLIIGGLSGAGTGYERWGFMGFIIGGCGGLLVAFALELFIIPPIMVLFEINDKLDALKRQ